MYHVYCDFDATITVHDVWNMLFRLYGEPSAFTVWQKLNTREYTATECITEACATVRDLDHTAAHELFISQELRSGFIEFVAFCREQGIPLTIVSDGFSCYIRPILAHHELDLAFYTNTVEMTNEGTLSVEFPHTRESCWRCGACKCGTIMTTSADEDTIVYVGDGYSDICPIEISDVIFARDMLKGFCTRLGLPFHPYEDFYEVRTILQTYLVERPKYKRKEAHKARTKLYVIE